MGLIDWSDPIFVLSAIVVSIGTPFTLYVLFTGRWIAWPVRPKRVPASAAQRRLAAAGALLILLTLGLGDLYNVPGMRRIPDVMRLFELPLIMLGLSMIQLGWKRPPEPVKYYRLEGWPPPKESGRR